MNDNERIPKEGISQSDWYDAIHPPLSDEYISSLMGVIPDRSNVIEPFAGTGRYTLPMLDNMHRVTAVDHNPVYLERLKSRAARSNNTNLLRTLCEEVSTIESMNEYFDVALIPNNGLHCVQSRGKQLDLLKEINKVIVPDGLLLLELFNPSVRRLTPRDQSSRQPHPYLSKSHPLPELGGSFIRYITIEYDEWTQINRVVFHDTIVTDNGDSTSKVTIEHHRLIFPGELIGLIQQASFDIISLGSAWGVDSRVSGGESIRLVARKRD